MLSAQLLQSCRREGGSWGNVIGAQGTFGKIVTTQNCNISSEPLSTMGEKLSVSYQRLQQLMMSLTWTAVKTKSVCYAKLVWDNLKQNSLIWIINKAQKSMDKVLAWIKRTRTPLLSGRITWMEILSCRLSLAVPPHKYREALTATQLC